MTLFNFECKTELGVFSTQVHTGVHEKRHHLMNQTIITGGKKPKPSADELFKTTAVIRKHIEESAMYANVSENVHMGKFDNTALRPDCIRSTGIYILHRFRHIPAVCDSRAYFVQIRN